MENLGKLTLPITKDFVGESVLLNNRVIIFSETSRTQESFTMVTNTITLCGPDMKARNRTTQVIDEKGMPMRVTNVIEKKVNEEDVYFEE